MNIFFITLSISLSALIAFILHKSSYWKRKGVKQLKTNFLFGTFFKLNSNHLSDLYQEVYDEFKGKAILAGTYIFARPIAVITDLDLVQSILVRDFNHFVNRTECQNEKNDPLTGHLFLVHGEKWRILRSKLTPTFTSGKMKFMFPTIIQVAKDYKAAIDAHIDRTPDGSIDVYDFMGRYTTDVIGSCAFGIECKSLQDPNVAFRQIGKQMFDCSHLSIRWRLLLENYGNIIKFLGIKRYPQSVETFVMSLVRDTVKIREKQNIRRNDFLDILIELKNTKDALGQPMLTFNEMAAQAFVFFAAGFETSSSNMTFAIYELAKNPSIQDKVRNEIIEVLEKHNGELTYEAMMGMKYLDQVLSETLRKYPALAGLTRITDADYRIPGTEITLKKGVKIIIPALAIHYDPDIYEEPNEFRPERFGPEEVKNRHPQAFLGFGDGPRNCIGLRFGRMQVRIGLITVLKSFRFTISEKSPVKPSISTRSFALIPGCETWLKVERL